MILPLEVFTQALRAQQTTQQTPITSPHNGAVTLTGSLALSPPLLLKSKLHHNFER